MPPHLQTAVALGIVALAALLLARSFLKRKSQPGCGGECGAVSPEMAKLRARLTKG